MPDGTALNYKYDGSFYGLLCCVYESVYQRELPDDIQGPDAQQQLSFFEQKEILTDAGKAARVLASIPGKICPDALDFVQRAFLSCLPRKEWYILQFLHLGYRHGRRVLDMLTHDVVHTLDGAVRHLGGEAHLLSGFIRFSLYGGGRVMAAQITPKNFVLPLLAPHFAQRYPGETFLIHDQTHDAVLLHEHGATAIQFIDDFEMAQPDEEELRYRRLWKMYYDTIAIDGRYNPTCRRTHMPKRYWHNMTEFASGRLGVKQALKIDSTDLKRVPR